MSKLFSIILLFSFLYTTLSFKCGSNKFEEGIASSIVDLHCKGQKVAINKCCLQHDRCYDRQDPKKNCDKAFCDCLSAVTKGNSLCQTLGTSHMCNIVKLFGQPVYDKAKKNKVNKTKVEKAKKDKKTKSDGESKAEEEFVNKKKKSKRNKKQKIEKTLSKEETDETELFNTTEKL
uniref:Phospholipase A2 domain-containing protein n=1 Tax=Strongyloides stercoralis TaxID=6248 RepID=A0A0K0E4N3_STRER